MVKVIEKKVYQYTVVFEPNGEGYTVTVPELPGLVTEGDNLKDAREMAKDAIRCYLEALLKDKVVFSGHPSKRERIKVAV
ncbi:MAG: type II toxin-antitoxin system HicB family antitoxin [bacterium]|nr:type II toxin-antitoxin system HicB family antitoxin [bacterium]